MKYFVIFISGLCYIYLGYFVKREDSWTMISCFSILFICYAYFLKNRIPHSFAFVFRLLLLLAIPALSDDCYRFIWDGRLLLHGINPYLYLPQNLITNTTIFDSALFHKLNSPQYYSVYPPLNQLIFGLSAWFSKGNLEGNIVFLRSFILLSEFGTIWLISSKKSPLFSPNAALYTLNPFIILELTGNLHFEAIMFFLILLSLYFFKKNLEWLATFFFALAVGIKLLPLLFIPLIIRKVNWKKGIVFTFFVITINIILFIPFFDKMLLINFLSSVNLYFQKFEFNASIYYLVRAIGYVIQGYNIIHTAGIVLGILTFALVIWLSFKKNISTQNCVLFIVSTYFLMSTTVHPWYISSLLLASVFTKFRFPVFWSAMLPLTYFSYANHPYHENLLLVLIEYSVVFGVMIYELRTFKDPKFYS